MGSEPAGHPPVVIADDTIYFWDETGSFGAEPTRGCGVLPGGALTRGSRPRRSLPRNQARSQARRPR